MFHPRLLVALLFMGALSPAPRCLADVTLIEGGVAKAVIYLKPGPRGYVLKAAEDLQLHLQRMSGAMIPIDTVGNEGSHPGLGRIYLGTSAATTSAGIDVTPLPLEHYLIRTSGDTLYIVGRDGGQDDWADLSDCQPGTLLGTSHLLGEILGVRWLWPGELGTHVPQRTTVVVPDLDFTAGPAMDQRKFRTPRIGLYLNGSNTYGFGVPVLPESATRRSELAEEELLWLRHQRMGSRKNVSFAHSFTQWWSQYGATHPEYFAELLPGRTQPHPAPDRVKLHVSGSDLWTKRIEDWVAAGAGNNLNICPNDSRSFCVCSSCLAWDRPSQAPEVVFDSSDARLGDRYARFYTEIANRARLVNPNVTVYGYAYDVYRNAPLEATVPDNVALAYIPGAPSDTTLDGIEETEQNVLGWIEHGCTQMYLRPNWMLSAHAGPFWPTHRLGEHFKRLTASGNIRGFDSDSSCSSYAGFGFYYYLTCRLIADPTLEVDEVVDEFCSGFGSAAPLVRDYLGYWELFANNQADSGSTEVLGWSSCVPAYPGAYDDTVFDGALLLLDAANAALLPGETEARNRLDFLRVACIHGRLTSQAIDLVDPGLTLNANPRAERALRNLLAYRDANADSFAVWREWMIDREKLVPGMQTYWTAVLADPGKGTGSNVGAFIESGGLVVMEAEHFTGSAAGTGTADGITWQESTGPSGSSGTVMTALPNAGIGTDTGRNGPRLDYKIDFHTAGTYYVFLRIPTLPGADDSVNIGLDGSLVQANLGNTTGSWRWRTTNPATVGLTITEPGTHTFNVWMREDGCTVDKVILSNDPSYVVPAGTDPGPAESGLRGSAEYFLTVKNGSGEGFYGSQSVVNITADAPPSGQVFARWTGDTAGLASTTAPDTFFTMPGSEASISATYRIDPILDTDDDGMPDGWEFTHFGDHSPTRTSDSDGDGQSDLAEYRAGTLPRDPGSRLAITRFERLANGDLEVSWDSVAGRSYTLRGIGEFDSGAWLPLAAGIAATPPENSCTVKMGSAIRFVRVDLD